MKLKDLKQLFDVKNIEMKKFKEDGTYLATIGVGKEAISLFITKATDPKQVDDNTAVNLINGKYFIGAVKEALDTIVI